MGRNLMIVAGEVSGDMYGGRLARALREVDPETRLIGIGGEDMAASGVELFGHISDLSVMGFWEVVREAGKIRRILRGAKEVLRQTAPDGLVLIDFYRFNIELAREAKRLGIPVVYYVAPKLWVWGKGRIRHLREYVDMVLAIFPFEEEFFRSQGMPVTYVGNPLIEIIRDDATADPEMIPDVEGADTVVSLLPGSRASEVRKLLPPFVGAAELISRELDGNVLFLLPISHTISRGLVEEMVAGASVKIRLVTGHSRQALRLSDMALVTSGTATLEAFLLGVPQVVAYRTSGLTYFLGKRIIRIERFSLPNILSGKEVVPELLQDEVIPERLARVALEILAGEGRMKEDYEEARQEVLSALKGGSASLLAASKVLEVVAGAEGTVS